MKFFNSLLLLASAVAAEIYLVEMYGNSNTCDGDPTSYDTISDGRCQRHDEHVGSVKAQGADRPVKVVFYYGETCSDYAAEYTVPAHEIVCIEHEPHGWDSYSVYTQ